jgi:hypothetical protein
VGFTIELYGKMILLPNNISMFYFLTNMHVLVRLFKFNQ